MKADCSRHPCSRIIGALYFILVHNLNTSVVNIYITHFKQLAYEMSRDASLRECEKAMHQYWVTSENSALVRKGRGLSHCSEQVLCIYVKIVY